MRSALVAAGLVSLLLLSACGGGGDTVASDPGTGVAPGLATTTSSTPPPVTVEVDDLRGRAFTATASDVDGFDLVAGTELELQFAERQLTVTAGCSTMTAPYDVVGGRISWTVEPVAAPTTCPGERQLQDSWVVDRLVAGLQAEATDDGLVLTSESPALEIDLTGRSAPTEGEDDPGLLGTTWEVVTTIDGDVASAVPAEISPPTLRLPGDGTATVFTGCNVATAPVAIEAGGDVVRIGDLALTQGRCAPEAQAVEEAVLQVVDGAVFAQLDGTSLTLTKGDAALVLRPA